MLALTNQTGHASRTLERAVTANRVDQTSQVNQPDQPDQPNQINPESRVAQVVPASSASMSDTTREMINSDESVQQSPAGKAQSGIDDGLDEPADEAQSGIDDGLDEPTQLGKPGSGMALAQYGAKLTGGAYIANGTYKCVIDASDPVGCSNGAALEVENPEQFVKVVMSESEFQDESEKAESIRDRIQDHSGLMTMSLADNKGVCKHAVGAQQMPDIPTKDGTRHCGIELDEPTDLVVAIVKRCDKFPVMINQRNVFLIYDVLHALFQFSKAEIVHCDVKQTNIVVDNQTAKLIDFGLTNHADYFKTMDDDMLAQAKYQVWPAVLTRLFNIPVEERQAIEELDDILLDIDKHGFAVMLIYWLQYVGLTTPTWQLF